MFMAYFNGAKSALHSNTADGLREQIDEIERDYGMSQFGSYTIYEAESYADAPNLECQIAV